MKLTLRLHGRAGKGYVIHPRTGEVKECEWTLTYQREEFRASPFSLNPDPVIMAPQETIVLEIELPDDLDRPAPEASSLPVVALMEATSG